MTNPVNNSHEYDIIIIGCGLVGGSLAFTLPDTLSIAIIDAEPPMQKQPGYLALNIYSSEILKHFGVWDAIATHHPGAVTAIKNMDVSELPEPTGQVLLHAEDIGAPALGYVTSTIAIRETLLNHIQSKKNITLYCPERAEDIQWPDEGMEKITAKLSESSQNLSLHAKLVIMADGGRSPLRQKLGFTIEAKKFAQNITQNPHIVITKLKATKPHQGLAFERFTTHGPIALLPVNQDEYILVWTMPETELTNFLAQDEKALLKKLSIDYANPEIKNWQEIHFSQPETALSVAAKNFSPKEHSKPERKSYPIIPSLVKNPIKTRLVLMGNAAHTVHPVGAQGFNLSLKDALNLSNLIHNAVKNKQDIGSEKLLKQYLINRQEDTDFVLYFTQSLLSVFSQNSVILSKIRSIGMSWINHSSKLKELLLKKTTGKNLSISQSDNVSVQPPNNGPNNEKKYDIIILGNRLIGSALACALDSHYRIAILDKAPTPPEPSSIADPNQYQLRINAYNRASEKLLKSIHVWDNIPSERRFFFDKIFATSEENNHPLSFDANNIGESHIGHFIENDIVTYYLHEQLKSLPNVDFYDQSSVVNIVAPEALSSSSLHASSSHLPSDQCIKVITQDNTIFSGKLLAACDGANSSARKLLNIDVARHPYYQRCIVANITFDGDLNHTAWQRFLKTGPLGLLPLSRGVCSLAWSCDNEKAQSLLALSDEEFAQELRSASLGRLGKILHMTPRQSFPLTAQHAEQYIAPRTMLLGDAAHTVHPLGGLGANLGFQDVIAATKLLNDPKIRERDIGRRYLLEKYEKMRRRHNTLVMSSMTAFNALFHQDHSALNPLGRLSLRLADKITPVKNAMFRQAMWMGNKI